MEKSGSDVGEQTVGVTHVHDQWFLVAFCRGVRLGSWDQQFEAAWLSGDVRDLDGAEFGAAKRARKCNQDEGTVAQTGRIVAAGGNQLLHFLGRQG